jgi:methionine sulfoxide reductase heme-binding subunit
MTDIRFSKIVLFINALVPLALMGWDGLHQRLGANPTEFFTRTSGGLTLVFVLLSLCVTPLRRLTGFNSLVRLRRMLGLYAFFYGLLHFLTYVLFDRALRLTTIPGDVLQRPFIAVGLVSFFMLVPLAITSTNGMVKRLGGKRWALLHRLAYLIAIGGVLHYYMIVKSDVRLPLAFALVLALLLGYRIYEANKPPLTSRPSQLGQR